MQVINFTVLNVQIMRCSCDRTTCCFNAVSKHVNAANIRNTATTQKQMNAYSHSI